MQGEISSAVKSGRVLAGTSILPSPKKKAAGVASPPPRSRQIGISRGDGLARDCSNGADTTPANSQLPSASQNAARRGWRMSLPPPKTRWHPPPLLHPARVHPAAWGGRPRDPRGGRGPILQNAKPGFLPRVEPRSPGLEHGALRLHVASAKGNFQTFPAGTAGAQLDGQVRSVRLLCARLTHPCAALTDAARPRGKASSSGVAPGTSLSPDPPCRDRPPVWGRDVCPVAGAGGCCCCCEFLCGLFLPFGLLSGSLALLLNDMD